MQARLLIINCPTTYFVHIPMGTFGLCDYLDQREIPCRILNLALYDGVQVPECLSRYLEEFRPTHVALIFHWQETVEGLFWVSEYVKSTVGRVKTICGGFTASYFGKNLLNKCQFVDYVVRGDPERPMELLLRGAEEHEIPNLIYRKGTSIRVSQIPYSVDERTISHISFSGLASLYDYQSYIKAVEQKLGFPLFIGRGCTFSCDYCGGSREAFRLHSQRVKPVTRTIPSVIADLKRLKKYTRKIYICYEIDLNYVKALFKAIKRETSLRQTFRLNYGTWGLLDRQFLELYKDAFIVDQQDKPLFEISPEVFDKESRQRLKHHNTYSIQELIENVDLINRDLKGSTKIYIYFSRYHDTAQTYVAVREEIFKVFRLKHDLVAERLTNVRVCYDHLSTDVGSRYWETYVDNPRDLDTLVLWTKRLRSQEEHSFRPDNLCIYTPKDLSEGDIYRCELLIFLLKSLETYAHELFHILFRCLGEQFVYLLGNAMAHGHLARVDNPFKSLDIYQLFNELERMILQDESVLSKIPFIEDLLSLQIKKRRFWSIPRQGAGHDSRKARVRLNHRFISVHNHDYLDLVAFLERLDKEGTHKLRVEKTVFVFLVDEIMAMPYDTYRRTLKLFEKGIALDQYYALMDQRGIFNRSYHENLVAKLLQSNLLR